MLLFLDPLLRALHDWHQLFSRTIKKKKYKSLKTAYIKAITYQDSIISGNETYK